MENKINVAALLKGCPKGMKLDCTLFEDVELDCIVDGNKWPIKLIIKDDAMGDAPLSLTKEGYYSTAHNPKCIIFPKGKTTWEGFQGPFVNGDAVATNSGVWIGLIEKQESGSVMTTHCVIKSDGSFEAYIGEKERWQFSRLATEEEKERLFKAIKDNGYKWNAEKKRLEKLIKPKFKVGDRIKHVVGREEVATVIGVEETHYNLDSKVGTSAFTISLQCEWELVPNKFDINTLKPYKSEVLYRNTLNGRWKPAFWGAYTYLEGHQSHKFLTTNGFAHYCIPYEGNEHLMGKQDDCSEFYKTWKE